MKKLFIAVSCMMGLAQTALAQTDSIAAEAVQTAEEQSTNWGELAISILILIVAIGIIAHMIYEYFIKKPHAAITVEDGAAARKNLGLKPMSDDEASALIQKMDDILDEWTPYKDENNEDKFVMTKFAQTKKTLALLDEVAAAHPDREDVVNRCNELNECYNDAMKRQYNGSTKYIVLCAVIAALMAWGAGGNWVSVVVFFGLQIAIYWLASMTPTYLLNKKALKGDGWRPKFMSGMIAGILGIAATAPTYVTITKWSDGTETKETDDSPFWISLIITIILLVVLAYFMFVVALLNYLRNYVLHF